jgi:norsolorinic acid ketoreductase
VASALEGQTVRRVTPADILDDVKINATGPVLLFQSFAELLLASHAAGGQPKFVAVSSLAARIVDPVPIEATAYGASKAALNYIMAKMNLEMPDIVAFPIQ